MALKDWVKIDRAYTDLVTWIRKPHGDDEVIVAKTNFVNPWQNFWYVKTKVVTGSHSAFNIDIKTKILEDKIKTKKQALKIAYAYMRSH